MSNEKTLEEGDCFFKNGQGTESLKIEDTDISSNSKSDTMNRDNLGHGKESEEKRDDDKWQNELFAENPTSASNKRQVQVEVPKPTETGSTLLTLNLNLNSEPHPFVNNPNRETLKHYIDEQLAQYKAYPKSKSFQKSKTFWSMLVVILLMILTIAIAIPYLSTKNNNGNSSSSSSLSQVQPTPSKSPSKVSILPSTQPSRMPSQIPSQIPSKSPSESTIPPSNEPSPIPSQTPSAFSSESTMPSSTPSPTELKTVSAQVPSKSPSVSVIPSIYPSQSASKIPSTHPIIMPSQVPSKSPSVSVSVIPSMYPSLVPSDHPSSKPSGKASQSPSAQPSPLSSQTPSQSPSVSMIPSTHPSPLPSWSPSQSPSKALWAQLGQNFMKSDMSGLSVSISADGKTVAARSTKKAGFVRVYSFQNNNDDWVQLGQDIEGDFESAYFDSAVSLSADGMKIAVGSPYSGLNMKHSGLVTVYKLEENNWMKLGQDIYGEASNEYSGSRVSLSADGSTVAIGAAHHNGVETFKNASFHGFVRIYTTVKGSWVKLGQDITGEASSDESGWSMSLSGDGVTVAIGAISNDGNGANSGHVRVFSFVNGVWSKLGQDLDGEASGDQSGFSVSLSSNGKVVAVGAPFNNGKGEKSGHVRVYSFMYDHWNKVGQDIDGAGSNYQIGKSMTLSADGSTIAISATVHAGEKKEFEQVCVYSLGNNFWAKVGQNINGEASSNQSGGSVSLSADGKTVVIGSVNKGKGHVRIYSTNLS